MSSLETGTPDLLARVEDGVAVLTMNRPDRRNALSEAMVDALARTLATVERDDSVGCVVLTGAGGRVLRRWRRQGLRRAAGTRADGYERRLSRQRWAHRETALRLWSMAKPTVAILPGRRPGRGCRWRSRATCGTRPTAW
jgi:2-(1,2-epoxy-1,2-dihydrophenyl)acetyl-CoA isomerase